MKISIYQFFVGMFFTVTLAGCMSTKGFVKDSVRLSAIKKIAVLPFASNDTGAGNTIADSLAAELVASRFVIVERSQIEKLLAERNLSIAGIVSGRENFAGKVTGVDAFILGSASTSKGFAGLAYGGMIDYVSTCSARMVDVITGEVLFAVNYKADSPNTWSGVSSLGKVAEKLATEFGGL